MVPSSLAERHSNSLNPSRIRVFLLNSPAGSKGEHVPQELPYTKTRGWYTVSVDTLRAVGVVVAVLVAAWGGWHLYQRWQARHLEREAAQLIDEVAALVDRAHQERPGGAFHDEYAEALTSQKAALASYDLHDYKGSVDQGRRSRALLLAVLDASGSSNGAGEAQFIAVQGDVEFRRGEQGEWETARSRDLLHSGDYVKTSPNGSAEIVFLDGTLYTVRPNTLFLVTRTRTAIGAGTEQAISMEYGWVDLNTAQRGGRVSTPRANARVSRDAEAAVSFDRSTSEARFSAYRGEVEVTSRSGVSRRIGPLEEVRQMGDLISDPKALPPPPTVESPPPQLETSLDADRKLVLSWQAVPGAARYALQVSRNRLFVDNLIDVDSRTKTRATLELRGEGTFQWRVAAVTKEGLQGPWSEPRTFRVSAGVRAGERGDKTPPTIELDQVQVYGNLFIVSGRTEPDATLRINGEPVVVAQNGTFTKTVLVPREGWSVLDLVAADPAGNVSTLRQRVFVETL